MTCVITCVSLAGGQEETAETALASAQEKFALARRAYEQARSSSTGTFSESDVRRRKLEMAHAQRNLSLAELRLVGNSGGVEELKVERTYATLWWSLEQETYNANRAILAKLPTAISFLQMRRQLGAYYVSWYSQRTWGTGGVTQNLRRAVRLRATTTELRMYDEQLTLATNLSKRGLISVQDVARIRERREEVLERLSEIGAELNEPPGSGEQVWDRELNYLRGIRARVDKYYAPALQCVPTKQSQQHHRQVIVAALDAAIERIQQAKEKGREI